MAYATLEVLDRPLDINRDTVASFQVQHAQVKERIRVIVLCSPAEELKRILPFFVGDLLLLEKVSSMKSPRRRDLKVSTTQEC